MADCERFKGCMFFSDKLPEIPRTAEALEETYCHGSKIECARYMVALKGVEVPANLFPNENNCVAKVLSHKKRSASASG